MSRHGIDTVKQAQKAERAIERCLSQIYQAVGELQSVAYNVRSETLTSLALGLPGEIEKAFDDSCLETFRDDCKQAVADWDGEEDFWRRFDLTCRVTP